MSGLPPGWAKTSLGEISQKPQYGWTTKADPDGEGIRLLRTTDITSGSIDLLWDGSLTGFGLTGPGTQLNGEVLQAATPNGLAGGTLRIRRSVPRGTCQALRVKIPMPEQG